MATICKRGRANPFGNRPAIGYGGSLHGMDGDSCR